MVGVARIELATPAMSTQCSTTELHAHAEAHVARGPGARNPGLPPARGMGRMVPGHGQRAGSRSTGMGRSNSAQPEAAMTALLSFASRPSSSDQVMW